MVNPVLRKLRRGGLSKETIADLLEKHIGEAPVEAHCETACEALRTIRDAPTRDLAELIRIFQDSNGFSACDVVKQVIHALRATGSGK